MTVTEQYNLWLARATEDPDLTAELKAVAEDADGINDRFYRDLAFGTGGLRGVIGAGTNRMNLYTIRRATQGLADYLNASPLPKKVALAHDSRHKGELFCREAARVLAANGITAYLYPRLEPTPALSWATAGTPTAHRTSSPSGITTSPGPSSITACFTACLPPDGTPPGPEGSGSGRWLSAGSLPSGLTATARHCPMAAA